MCTQKMAECAMPFFMPVEVKTSEWPCKGSKVGGPEIGMVHRGQKVDGPWPARMNSFRAKPP